MALDLRRELSGDRHITLVVLLWKIGDRQATMSSVNTRYLMDSVTNLELALDISKYHGCNSQHVCGYIHLSLSRARIKLGEEEKAEIEVTEAEQVLESWTTITTILR